ncbi:MAG: phage tail protein [Flexilinea sp.]|nr:phage tail protein [Flexilinea sp.]
MSVLDTLTNNTILMPTMDSLVSSNPLPDTPVGKKVQEYNKGFEEKRKVEAKQFELFIVSGEKSVLAGFCEQVEGLSVKRNVDEKRSGGNGEYLVKLPGALSFGVVKLSHLYCENDLFLNWMINGAEQGGVQKADIEVKVGPDNDHMVYTLRDAFPIGWHLGTLSVNAEGLVTNKETMTYTIDADQLLVENVSIAYGRLDYKRGQ